MWFPEYQTLKLQNNQVYHAAERICSLYLQYTFSPVTNCFISQYPESSFVRYEKLVCLYTRPAVLVCSIT